MGQKGGYVRETLEVFGGLAGEIYKNVVRVAVA